MRLRKLFSQRAAASSRESAERPHGVGRRVTLSVVSGSIGVGESGTVIIDYGVPVTNALNTAAPNAIMVTVCDTGPDALREDQVTVSKNTIEIKVESTDACGADH